MLKDQFLLTVFNRTTSDIVDSIIDPTEAKLSEMKALYPEAEFEHEYINALTVFTE
jgi:hypothetical protein